MINFATGCKSKRKTIIYESGSALSIVYAQDTPLEKIENFSNRLNNIRGELSKIKTDDAAQTKFEIVVGRTNRPVSQKAYNKLNEVNKINNEFSRYVFYCESNSLAIAYEEDQFNTTFVLDAAINKFLSSYAIKGSLIVEEGMLTSGSINIVNEQRKLDEVARESKWQSANKTFVKKYKERYVNQGMDSDRAQQLAEEFTLDLISAFKDLYECYDPNVVYWLADLYDINAGFYYSNSARDTAQTIFRSKTIQFGSDLESTHQALEMLKKMGVFQNFKNNSAKDGLPEEFVEHIVTWAKSLQDPNGYFYHPQWESFYSRDGYGNILTDELPTTRRSRDLSRARDLFSLLEGGDPIYNYPGTNNDVIVETSSKVTDNKPNIIKTAEVEENMSTDINDYLGSETEFRKYLDEIVGPKMKETYNVGNNPDPNKYAYQQSNFLNTQIGTIKNHNLQSTLISWLNEFQDKNTGLWINPSHGVTFDAINSAFKIVSVYNALNVVCPNPLLVAENSFAILKNGKEDEFAQVVYLYNTWNTLKHIIQNVKSYGNPNELNDVMAEIYSNAPSLIRKTTTIVKSFMKQDGSSSYNKTSSSYTSQDMQVAVRYTNEGDVNATAINTQGVLTAIFNVFDVTKVYPFGEAERMQFILAIERQTPIVKKA